MVVVGQAMAATSAPDGAFQTCRHKNLTGPTGGVVAAAEVEVPGNEVDVPEVVGAEVATGRDIGKWR
jgi:hypothetical protein